MHGVPNVVVDPIPFEKTKQSDPRWRCRPALSPGAGQNFTRLRTVRASYLGKVSPVHLFWGSFDLAVTRFSGRSAPLHPGGVPGLPDNVSQEAYSHEVSSASFWPGGSGVEEPMFYSYAYPDPRGSRTGRPSRKRPGSMTGWSNSCFLMTLCAVVRSRSNLAALSRIHICRSCRHRKLAASRSGV